MGHAKLRGNLHSLLVLSILTGSGWARVQTPSDGVERYLQQGFAYKRAFDNQNALEIYKKAHALDPTNCSAIWRMAEAYVDLGEDADEKLQRQYFYLAEKWARQAVAQCPDSANAHFMLAMASGHLALLESGGRQLKRSKEVKAEAERTLELDPGHHGAYHLLGRWHAEVAGLSWVRKAAAKIVYGGVPPGASYTAAIENLKKAIAISPNWIHHHRELGEIYVKLKQYDLARQEFETVLRLPIRDHEDARHKARCREWLKRLGKKR